MNIDDVHRFLDAIPQFKNEGSSAADFSLERFRKFCEEIGNPQDDLQCIHIAGSNGKGSTCHILGSVYQSAGYNVGVYTSPHILHFAERFTIDSQTIDNEALVRFISNYQSLIKRYRLTYFEVSTAIAFWWFARSNVDVAIIETGLGGRLDATNIITPLASVITNVTLDHTDILGDSLAAIAREKAGIIKDGVPVVTGNIPEAAGKEIRHIAADKNSTHYAAVDLQPALRNGTYFIHTGEKEIALQSELDTPVQVYNIAVSWQAAQCLQHMLPVTENEFSDGVRKVRTRYSNLGRFEKLLPGYQWYFDGGHNIAAVRAMKEMVETKQPVEETILVLSLMKDKINEKMMNEFLEFKKIVYHTLPLERAATLDDIQNWLPAVDSLPATQDIPNTLTKEFGSELVIFSGSFYFYATVRDWLSTIASY